MEKSPVESEQEKTPLLERRLQEIDEREEKEMSGFNKVAKMVAKGCAGVGCAGILGLLGIGAVFFSTSQEPRKNLTHFSDEEMTSKQRYERDKKRHDDKLNRGEEPDTFEEAFLEMRRRENLTEEEKLIDNARIAKSNNAIFGDLVVAGLTVVTGGLLTGGYVGDEGTPSHILNETIKKRVKSAEGEGTKISVPPIPVKEKQKEKPLDRGRR